MNAPTQIPGSRLLLSPAAPVPVDAAHSGPAVSSVSAGPAGADVSTRQSGASAPATRSHDNPVAKALGLAVRQLIQLQAPRVRGLFDAQDFIGRKELLERLAAIVDPVIAAIASEGSEHSHEIDRSYFTTVLADAMIDRSLLSAFEVAAEKWIEDNGQFGVGA
mgnify:CR=1 FL=1